MGSGGGSGGRVTPSALHYSATAASPFAASPFQSASSSTTTGGFFGGCARSSLGPLSSARKKIHRPPISSPRHTGLRKPPKPLIGAVGSTPGPPVGRSRGSMLDRHSRCPAKCRPVTTPHQSARRNEPPGPTAPLTRHASPLAPRSAPSSSSSATPGGFGFGAGARSPFLTREKVSDRLTLMPTHG